MVNKKKVILYCCTILVFAIYLFNANDIILLFDRDEKIEKVSFDIFESNTDVTINLSDCENLGGILERVYFQGWAFCETLYDNSSKKVSLIFKSVDSEDCFAVDTLPQYRPDVYGAFSESKNIWNSMNGIDCQFSTVKMKEGTYDFYVYVQENDYNCGLYDPRIRYVKDSKGLTKIVEE